MRRIQEGFKKRSLSIHDHFHELLSEWMSAFSYMVWSLALMNTSPKGRTYEHSVKWADFWDGTIATKEERTMTAATPLGGGGAAGRGGGGRGRGAVGANRSAPTCRKSLSETGESAAAGLIGLE